MLSGAEPGLPTLANIAHFVRAELAAAGLPVAPEDHPPGTAGAVVRVDTDAGAVTVDWALHEVLVSAALDGWADDPERESAESGEFSRQLDAVGAAMRNALREIITAAGYEVSDNPDPDFAPHRLLVTRRLAESPWLERRFARAEKRHDAERAAREDPA